MVASVNNSPDIISSLFAFKLIASHGTMDIRNVDRIKNVCERGESEKKKKGRRGEGNVYSLFFDHLQNS